MRVALLYLHVVGRSDENSPPPEHYLPWSKRWVDSYQQFKGTVPHDLWVMNCGADLDEKLIEFYPPQTQFGVYKGAGWDVGAYQHWLKQIDYDFAICMGTPTYLWRAGFIEAMVAAREKYGDGMYGPTVSFEHWAHIRTCCWACDPLTFRNYPLLVDNRAKTFMAESRPESITKWYLKLEKPVKLVACDGVYDLSEGRKPANIFRRGDQSNCLIRDRHSDIYDQATADEKIILERLADGKMPEIREFDS